MAKRFFNRDLSWLSFNQRVLQEAKDPSVPLYERMKFLAIFASNLDEFYRIRVAEWKRLNLLSIKTKKVLKENPREILKKSTKLFKNNKSSSTEYSGAKFTRNLKKIKSELLMRKH
jgi:polyphosphate kinase